MSGSSFPGSFGGIRNGAGSGTGEVMGLLSPVHEFSVMREGRTLGTGEENARSLPSG